MRQESLSFSVIIPVASGENAWRVLIEDLDFLTLTDEIIIVSPDLTPNDFDHYQTRLNIKWIYSKPGRAKQLNTGSKLAQNDIFWFVHCDSRISKRSFECLKKQCLKNSKKLYYFDLKFSKDGPRFMFVNEWGVYIRSRLLKMPFGDQGFCLSKDNFNLIGSFDEQCSYGEDHLFVWNAKIKNISVKSVGASIFTSSRRYRQNGWAKTTVVHLWKTYYQALPKFLELIGLH